MNLCRYEIILKQNVGTEDVFLGLSGKDPSSMKCEAMKVRTPAHPGAFSLRILLKVLYFTTSWCTYYLAITSHVPQPDNHPEYYGFT
jgi:hypothetical protein